MFDLFHHLDNGIVVLDENFIVEYLNPVVKNTFKQETISTSLFNTDINQHLKLKNTDFEIQNLNTPITISYEDQSFELKISVFDHETKNFFLISFTDITKYTHREQLLEKKYRLLEDFIYIVSHDLQSPLRQIRSYLDLVLYQFNELLDDKSKTWISFIDTASKRMQNHIKSLLIICKINNFEDVFNEFDFNSSLERVTSVYAEDIKNCKVQIITNNSSKIFASETLLEILLQNLIENAIKFRNKNLDEPKIEISITENKLYWKILVKDNGIGIDSDKQSMIFDRFKKISNDASNLGSGLGLFICKRIVEIHNGYINLNSIKGEGSSFEICLAKKIVENQKNKVREYV
ncbi:MAG: hypothetical protein HRT47_09785 [Candidatus Caenarcaniphilales bacterium]|nr:hypothetical protein [Candidatus Caenarcaniphilales bacterium]